MTINVYEDGMLYSDRALIAVEAGIYTNNYSRKMFIHEKHLFALTLAGDEVPPGTEKAVMRLVEDFLTLVYAMEETDPYPPCTKLAAIIESRGMLVMTRDRAFQLKRKPGSGIGNKKPEIAVVEAAPGQRFVTGNCGPFYLVERALGTDRLTSIERAVAWKMGKSCEIDVISASDLMPFACTETVEGEGHE